MGNTASVEETRNVEESNSSDDCSTVDEDSDVYDGSNDSDDDKGNAEGRVPLVSRQDQEELDGLLEKCYDLQQRVQRLQHRTSVGDGLGSIPSASSWMLLHSLEEGLKKLHMRVSS